MERSTLSISSYIVRNFSEPAGNLRDVPDFFTQEVFWSALHVVTGKRRGKDGMFGVTFCRIAIR